MFRPVPGRGLHPDFYQIRVLPVLVFTSYFYLGQFRFSHTEIAFRNTSTQKRKSALLAINKINKWKQNKVVMSLTHASMFKRETSECQEAIRGSPPPPPGAYAAGKEALQRGYQR